MKKPAAKKGPVPVLKHVAKRITNTNPRKKMTAEVLNAKLSDFAKRFKLKWVAVILVLLHISVSIIIGTIFSTVFMTLGMYLLGCWGLIFLIKKFRFNPNFIWSAAFVVSLLFVVELYLRYVDRKYQNYMERNGSLFYFSQYRLHNWWGNDYRLNDDPHAVKTEKKKEFTYVSHYNNLGFRGADVHQKTAGELRILAFGDSFTEGVGVPDDSTWTNLLQQKLKNTTGSLVSVINMGKSGCDPIYCLHEFKDPANHYDNLGADVVLLAVNSSDIIDIEEKGGNERYHGDRVRLRTSRWWEFFNSYSFIARAYTNDLLKWYYGAKQEKLQIKEYTDAKNELVKTIEEFKNYCAGKNIKFYVILMPIEPELEQKDLAYWSDDVYRSLKDDTTMPVIFLPKMYAEKMKGRQTSPDQYYWKEDFHHNGKGYDLFAECVSERLTVK